MLRKTLRSLALPSLALWLPLAASAAAISVNPGVSANSKLCDQVTWTDSTGQPRSLYLEKGRPQGTRLVYVINGSTVTDNEMNSHMIGEMIHHGSCGSLASRSSSVMQSAGVYFQGQHHLVYRYTFQMPSCGNAGYSYRVTEDWVFTTGRDDFLLTVAYDSSDIPAATSIGDDLRGPYIQTTWLGGGKASGVGFGNHWKFRSTSAFTPVPASCAYSCSGNMSWTWNEPNVIPYVWEWATPGSNGAVVDRELGVVQTQPDREQDFGGAFYGAGNLPASLPAVSVSPHPMFECWAAPSQMNCYDSAWDSGRITWGTTYQTFNNGHQNDRGQVMAGSFRPINAWSWNIHWGKASDNKVMALVSDTEAMVATTATASLGSLKASGPRATGNYVGPSVGSMPVVPYTRPGVDPVYRVWRLIPSGGNAALTLQGAGLDRPTFVLEGVSAVLPCQVTLDGVDQVSGTDYVSSYDSALQHLYVSFLKKLPAGSAQVALRTLCGSPTSTRTPCAACSPTVTPSATPTLTVTPTWSPTPACTPRSFDNLDDGNTQNDFSGYWYTYAGSSTINPAAWAPTAPGYGGSGSCARAYGNNVTSGSPSLGSGLATGGTDLSMHEGVRFWFRGDGGTYRLALHSLVEGGNYNDYKADFTPPVGWSQVTLPFSSFSHPGWGPAYPMDLVQLTNLSWIPMTAGAFDFSVDEIQFLCATPSPTPSPAGSASSTRTASPSPSASPTPSATRSATRTASPSPSPSSTPTATGTTSATRSTTPTPTATWTPSLSPSVSASPSASPSISPTWSPVPPGSSATVTPSGTPTPSPTPTGTPSQSQSPTRTSTPMATGTTSASPTATPSPSLTGSPTATASPTRTPTSPAGSATASATPTRTPAASATPSATPQSTGSPTPSPQPTASPSSAPSSGAVLPAEPVKVITVLGLPNPNPRRLAVKVSGSCERLILEVFSPALAKTRRAEVAVQGSGWLMVDLPEEWRRGMPAGLCYVRVLAQGPAGQSRGTGKLVVLP